MKHTFNADLAVDFDTALESLTSGIYAFSAITKRIEQRVKDIEDYEENLRDASKKVESRNDELELREAWIKEREAQLKEWEVQVKERDAQVSAMETQIAARMRELGEMEARWVKTEKRMELNASKLPQKIKLNVGGQQFTTSKTTLLQFKGSYFESIVHSNNSQQDDNGFFIDRDPKHFGTILNFMRDGKIRTLKTKEIEELEREFKFYKIPAPVHLTPPKVSPSGNHSSVPSVARDSNLRDSNSNIPNYNTSALRDSNSNVKYPDSLMFENGGLLSSVYQTAIKMWIPNHRFSLIYKATRDGFKALDFHRTCDNQGPTLTLIYSKEGYLFGGYSPEAWESPPNNFSKVKTHPNTFIFSLSSPHSHPPTRFSLKPGTPFSILCCSSYCAAFGGGPDIYVSSDSHQGAPSYTKFPSSFVDTLGRGRDTFTGSLNFTSREVEVYSVLPI